MVLRASVGTSGGGGGGGDVTGPESSAAGNITVFADGTGKLIGDSGQSLSALQASVAAKLSSTLASGQFFTGNGSNVATATTATATTALLDEMVGSSAVSAGTKGMVPPSSAGDQDKVLSAGGVWVPLTAGGDVSGPASSTDANIATFDGITGKLIQDGGTSISAIQSSISSKLSSTLASGQFFTGNGSNVATATTATATTALLDAMVGASAGAAGTKGLVPAGAAGDEGKFLRGDATWVEIPAGGDVDGPASAVDQNLVTFDGTTGKLIQDSGTSVSAISTAIDSKLGKSLVAGSMFVGSGTNEAAAQTASQVTTLLDVMTAATSGSGGVKGLVPPSSAGDEAKFLRADATWASVSGGGDVFGPASSTDSHLAVFDGTTGKLLKDGGLTVATIQAAVDAKLDKTLTTGQFFTGDGSNVAVDTTATAATALLDAMVGASSGTAGTKGLVPAGAAGDEGKFLRGDGVWAAISTSGGISVIDAVVDGTGTDPDTYATVSAAINAGKTRILATATNTSPSVVGGHNASNVTKGVTLFIADGVSCDFTGTIYTNAHSFTVVLMSETSEIDIAPTAGKKCFQKDSGNAATSVPVVISGPGKLTITGASATENLGNAVPFHISGGINIFTGGASDTGVNLKIGSSLRDATIHVASGSLNALTVADGAVVENVAMNDQGVSVGQIINNSGAIRGIQVYGGGSYTVLNSGNLLNLTQNPASVSTCISIKPGADESYFEDLDCGQFDIDPNGKQGVRLVNCKNIGDIAASSLYHDFIFDNCEIAGTATAFIGTGHKFTNCEFTTLSIGNASFVNETSDFYFANCVTTNFSVVDFLGDMKISSCSDNIRYWKTKTGAYQATGNELIFADATSSSFVITAPASPSTGQLFNVKAVGNGTNNITVSAPASVNLDGQASRVLAPYESLSYVYNGTQWLSV